MFKFVEIFIFVVMLFISQSSITKATFSKYIKDADDEEGPVVSYKNPPSVPHFISLPVEDAARAAFQENVSEIASSFIRYFLTENAEDIEKYAYVFHTGHLKAFLLLNGLPKDVYDNFNDKTLTMMEGSPKKLTKNFWTTYKTTISTIFDKTRTYPDMHDCTISLLAYYSTIFLKKQHQPRNDFLSWIYQQNQTSDLAKYSYARHCLDLKADKNLIAKICEELLEIEHFQTEICYSLYVQALFFQGKYEKAVDELRISTLLYEENSLFSLTLGVCYFLTGSHDECIKELNRYVTLPGAETGSKYVKSFILMAYAAAGNTEKVSELLQQRQREALNRQTKMEERIVAKLREYQVQNKMQQEQARVSQPAQVPATPKKNIPSTSESSENTLSSNLPVSSPAESKNLKSQYKTDQVPKKPKKVGKSQPPVTQAVKAGEVIPPQKEHVRIEKLIEGKPYKTFCLLFDSLNGIDHKISMSKYSKLCDALKHDCNPTKGKGSHTKITIGKDFVDAGSEKMLILSKQNFLSAAQISDIVYTFLEYHLYPDYMEDTLRQKMPWLFDLKR